MNRCPITYECLSNGKYSQKGLRFLSRNLKSLQDFPYTANEQVELASHFFSKLSIQGVQPKLSLILNTKNESFEVAEKGGTYILKPPNPHFKELPQNEDLTMRLAKTVGIEVPFHGMIYNIDGSLSYFIKRFDRVSKKQKIATEDFSQLLAFSRDTKYDSSMEQVISVLEKHCTFPAIEKLKLFRLTLFNFLVGNEDMHLKKFSLIRRLDKVELSPAYDLVNSTIVFPTKEEIALPLRGKKSRLNRSDLITYFGLERLGLPESLAVQELENFKKAIDSWDSFIDQSFLSLEMQKAYKDLIVKRAHSVNSVLAS